MLPIFRRPSPGRPPSAHDLEGFQEGEQALDEVWDAVGLVDEVDGATFEGDFLQAGGRAACQEHDRRPVAGAAITGRPLPEPCPTSLN